MGSAELRLDHWRHHRRPGVPHASSTRSGSVTYEAFVVLFFFQAQVSVLKVARFSLKKPSLTPHAPLPQGKNVMEGKYLVLCTTGQVYIAG